jgi:hypothetical protein
MSERIDVSEDGAFKGRFSLSYVNEYLDLFVYFHDQNDALVDVTTPSCVVTRAKDNVNVVTGTPTRLSIGYYQYSFYAGAFDAGLYDITFTGAYGTISLVVKGQMGLQEITVLQSFINDVRYNLYEVDSTWLGYQLDSPTKYWTEEMIYRALNHTLMITNEHPPMITSWTFASIPCPGLLIAGATAECLLQRARLEDANSYSYTDAGKTLNIQRGQFYRQMAEEWNRQFRGVGGVNGGGVVGFKYAYRPKIVAVGSQRLPFKVLRPLSFLPGMKNIFGV